MVAWLLCNKTPFGTEETRSYTRISNDKIRSWHLFWRAKDSRHWKRNSVGHIADSKTVLIIMLSIWLMVLHSFLGYSCGFTVQAQFLIFSLLKPNIWGPNRSDSWPLYFINLCILFFFKVKWKPLYLLLNGYQLFW